MGWDKLLIKNSFHVTINARLDNITILHCHSYFPGISHIHHRFHWFQHGHRWFHSCLHTTTRKKDLHDRHFWKNWFKYGHFWLHFLSSLCIFNVWLMFLAILISMAYSHTYIFSFSGRYTEWIDGINFVTVSETSSGECTANWPGFTFLKMTFITASPPPPHSIHGAFIG